MWVCVLVLVFEGLRGSVVLLMEGDGVLVEVGKEDVLALWD